MIKYRKWKQNGGQTYIPTLIVGPKEHKITQQKVEALLDTYERKTI